MKRPYQTEKPFIADNDDLLQATEDAMSSIAAAMNDLRGLWELDHIFDALGRIYDDLEDMHSHYEAIAMEEQRKEEEALTRDYWRMVLPL